MGRQRTSGLRRVTGMGSAGSLALALLAGGCVLAATAGPRLAQATQGRALQQTVAAVSPTARDIVVSTSWAVVSDDLGGSAGSGENVIVPAGSTGPAGPTSQAAIDADVALTPQDMDQVTTQLRRDFGTGPLQLSPRSADWAGMTPTLFGVAATRPIPSLGGVDGEIEVAYRTPTAGHLRLVSGSMPDTQPLPTANSNSETFPIQVVVTPPTASRFGLRAGSKLPLAGPPDPKNAGKTVIISLDVTGIVEPADPSSSFWTADPLLPGPVLDRVGGVSWDGAVIADPGESAMMQHVFGWSGLRFQWELPTDAAGPHGQPQALFDQVNQITTQAPALTGKLAPMASSLTVSSGLLQPLAAFITDASDLEPLLLIVYAGLAVASVVTLLLAAWMIAVRRSAELATRRARGASTGQLFLLGARGAAVACVPAAAIAWAAAVLLLPGAAPPGPAAWWPGAAALGCAVAGPGLVAARQHRLRSRTQARRRHPRLRWPWLPRVVFEVTACAAAVGGIVVFRSQQGATGLYAGTAPVLIAVPAVIVALRVYQLLLRLLARAAARRRGVIGFVGLTRAAHAPVALVLPAVTLVLALTVAAFTGMVRAAVASGETAASWQVAGADVTIAAPGPAGLSAEAVRAIGAVPGVEHAAAVLTVPLTVEVGGKVVTAVVADPASYAALVAATQGYAPVLPQVLDQAADRGPIPVLASPQAAAALGGPDGGIIPPQEGLPGLHVRVAGELPSTPAMSTGGTSGDAFIVLARAAFRGAPPPNVMLLTGPSIDMTRLRAAVRATTPGGAAAPLITTRSDALRELTGAPLQQGTFLLFTLAIGYAAVLALATALLGLALGTADREVTNARLATMGLTEGQRVRLVAVEVVPAILASAVAAAACAAALPSLVSPVIDLSVFTRSAAPVPLRPDLAAFLLPLAVLLAVSAVAVAYEVRAVRGRGVAAVLRM
jgi:putative ABC transport system permease protein